MKGAKITVLHRVRFLNSRLLFYSNSAPLARHPEAEENTMPFFSPATRQRHQASLLVLGACIVFWIMLRGVRMNYNIYLFESRYANEVFSSAMRGAMCDGKSATPQSYEHFRPSVG